MENQTENAKQKWKLCLYIWVLGLGLPKNWGVPLMVLQIFTSLDFFLTRTLPRTMTFSICVSMGKLCRNIQYTRAVLSSLLSGSVYNGHRYQAAGLRSSACCPHCGVHETHSHMFRHCETLQEYLPPQGDEPLLPWVTGIHFEPPQLQDSSSNVWELPVMETRWRPLSVIFVDGNVFSSQVGANLRRSLRSYNSRSF